MSYWFELRRPRALFLAEHVRRHPWARAFFFPFVVIATFTILNLFIGIIVSNI